MSKAVVAFRASLASSGLGENKALEEHLDTLLLNLEHKTEVKKLLQECGVHKLGHHFRVVKCLKVAAAAADSERGGSGQTTRPPIGLLDGLSHLSQHVQTMTHLQRLVAVAKECDDQRRQGLRFFCEAAEVTSALCAAADAMLAKQIPTATEVHEAHIKEWAKTFQICCALLVYGGPRESHMVLRPCDNGFFAAFLGVIDSLMMMPADAEVSVEWRPAGNETHFTYALDEPGTCVWGLLFEPLHLNRRGGQPTVIKVERFNAFLRGHHKHAFLTSPFAAQQRLAYKEIIDRHVHVRHPAILHALQTIGGQLDGGVSLGVHKRVATAGTADMQGIKSVLSVADFVRATRTLHDAISTTAGPVMHIYLATDDEAAVGAFVEAFGHKLVWRPGVRRVAGGSHPDGALNELHIRSAHNPQGSTTQDAVDVLTDALLLAKCHTVLHMDSNVTTAVALLAPTATMVHVAHVLGRGAPDVFTEVDKRRLLRAMATTASK